MRRAGLITLLCLLAGPIAAPAAPALLELPAFPVPALVKEGGATVEISTTRLLRELHRGGVRGSGNLETVDAEYALLRSDSLGTLAAWLESACRAVGFTLSKARGQPYDGAVHARLLNVATGLAGLQQQGTMRLAVPIGTLVCVRRAKWGDLPGDGATDAYVIFATEAGIMVYDPPTRQLSNLADFPNREKIVRIRF
ncbi:MAG: hypothetical protein V4773_09810 [Verrucomicrobiota bacterium]